MPTPPLLSQWITPQDVCLGDPLCHLFYRNNHVSTNKFDRFIPWTGILIGLCIGLVLFLPGFFISAQKNSASTDLLLMTHPDEMLRTIFFDLLYPPFIWFAYLWQPGAIAAMLSTLHDNQYLSTVTRNVRSPILGALFRQSALFALASTKRKLAFGLISLLALGAGTWLASLNRSQPCSSGLYCYDGKKEHWVYQDDVYFFIWCLLNTIPVLLALIIGLRQIILSLEVARLLRFHDLRPIPFYPDNCGGLSFVGRFTVRVALIAICIGIAVSLLFLFPLLANESVRIGWFEWFAIILFTFGSPVFFLLPTWSVHKALENAKTSLLTSSFRLREMVFPSSPYNPTPSPRELQDHIELARNLSELFGTLPFPRFGTLIFFLAYISPLILGLISLVI